MVADAGGFNRNCGCSAAPMAPAPGPTRAGHGVVFVERSDGDTWSASWCDLGQVHVTGTWDFAVSWAWQQPAAEHLLVLDNGAEAPLVTAGEQSRGPVPVAMPVSPHADCAERARASTPTTAAVPFAKHRLAHRHGRRPAV